LHRKSIWHAQTDRALAARLKQADMSQNCNGYRKRKSIISEYKKAEHSAISVTDQEGMKQLSSPEDTSGSPAK
jgi:hypothetical protein